MSAILTDLSVEGRVAAGEQDLTVVRKAGPGDTVRPPLIYCHPHQQRASTTFDTLYLREMLATLAEDYTIVASDLGFTSGCDTWGSQLHINRVGECVNYARNVLGATTGPVTMIAVSHGALGALNWAKANPGQVAAIAGIVPALNVSSLRQVNGGAYATCIDSRYSGGYSNASYGDVHSPYVYRDSFPTSTDLAVWTASDDDIVLPQWSDAFCAATGAPNFNLGALGHTDAAIEAAVPGVVQWIRGQHPRRTVA